MQEHPYNVIVGRHLLVTDPLKEYVEKKLHKLERLSDNIIDIHVTFENQRSDHHAAILLHVGHYMVRAEAVDGDTYRAFDRSVTKLKNLLHKYKGKLTNHHRMPHKDVNMMVNVYGNKPTETDLVNEAIEEENAREESQRHSFHKIVRQEKKPLKTLSVEEALIKMELSSEPFMIFRGQEDQKIKILYRMKDESYGLAQPE